MMEFSDEDSLAVLSSPKIIAMEYRFIVCDKKVITGSIYKIHGKIERQLVLREDHKDAWNFAQKAAETWQPESAFAVDVAYTNGNYSLIEINSFSCSGLYKCDSEIIVREISILAKKEFDDYHIPS